MKTKNLYKSYNNDKTIEELQYNMLQYQKTLESFKTEYAFFKQLLRSSIFESNVINLFESLELFKKSIKNLETLTTNLITNISAQSTQITKKIECDDLVCDNYFIKSYDELEREIHNLLIKYPKLKSQMLPYLQSVLKH